MDVDRDSQLLNSNNLSNYVRSKIVDDKLFNEILIEYKSKNTINKDKMKLCIEILNNYYDGVVGIENAFNI
ncbi:MAG: hypothetical protein RSF02_00570 [Bacilli bacterium]